MLELLGELTIEEPGDDVLDQLLVGLSIEADRVLVVGRRLFGAIVRGAVDRDLGIGVDSLSVGHLLLVAQVNVTDGFDLGRWLIVFDLIIIRVAGNCFTYRSSLHSLSFLGTSRLFLAGEQTLLDVVLDLLGASVVLGVIELVQETVEAVVRFTEEVEEVYEQLLGHLVGEALLPLPLLLPDRELLLEECLLGCAQLLGQEHALGATRFRLHAEWQFYISMIIYLCPIL